MLYMLEVPWVQSLDLVSIYTPFLVTSSSLMALNNIYTLMPPKFIPLAWPPLTHISYCLFNNSTWISNEHCELNMSQTELL